MPVSGLPEFEAAMDAMKAAVGEATKAAVAQGAHMIEASAKAHSSGRPGPNAPSGSHRRSIHVEGPTETGPYEYKAQIGPSMIYSRRLELGFSGADSLGRVYHQPPFPYLRPALDEVTPALEGVFVRAWTAATSG